MKITRISWENYKGLTDGAIEAHGNNVTISGRNGAGKSSIASVLPFILFGKDTDTVKQFVDGLTPRDDGLIHGAEVTFDDGTTLRREYFWSNSGNRQALYIDGASVSQSAFKVHVEKITRGGGELVINPFAFCNLKADIQRDILLKIFGTVSDADLLAAEFPELAERLNGQSVDEFITRVKNKMRSLKAETAAIPGQIEELQRQIDVGDIDAELRTVDEKLNAAQSERAQLSNCPTNDPNLELARLQKQVSEFKRRKIDVQEEIDWLNDELAELRTEYVEIQAAAGVCPTCGQALPADFQKKRAARLAAIVERGLKYKSEVERREKILADIGTERGAVENQIAQLRASEQMSAATARRERLTALDNEIYKLTTRKGYLQSQTAILNRIQTLRDSERDLNRQIVRLEGRLDSAENFRLRKIQLVEETINGHFEHVRFKLFDYLITTGETRPTCEATLNGVPYSALSKGERLRAALDIFRSLQIAFGTELPVMLDDAEAYTSNSLVGIPNQIFAFKVTDGELTISIAKESLAA